MYKIYKVKNMTSGYHISKKGRENISSAMKKKYAGPEGPKLRA